MSVSREHLDLGAAIDKNFPERRNIDLVGLDDHLLLGSSDAEIVTELIEFTRSDRMDLKFSEQFHDIPGVGVSVWLVFRKILLQFFNGVLSRFGGTGILNLPIMTRFIECSEP